MYNNIKFNERVIFKNYFINYSLCYQTFFKELLCVKNVQYSYNRKKKKKIDYYYKKCVIMLQKKKLMFEILFQK